MWDDAQYMLPSNVTNLSLSFLHGGLFVLLHLKMPLLLSRCKQGKILWFSDTGTVSSIEIVMKDELDTTSLKKCFQISLNLSPLDLYTELICLPVWMNLGIPGKMHNFCTSSSLYQNTQKTGCNSACLLIAAE